MTAPNPLATNQRITVGPDGEPVMEVTFAEEPLGMPASAGYGYADIEFGAVIGPDNRYIIIRKLGWGGSSSTWLGRDNK